MPRNINPIRKALLKKSLKKGNSQAQALRDAGFANSTAHSRVGDCVSLKIVKNEIAQELKHSDITPDLIIKHFEEDRTLALAKKDYATATRVDELMGKSIAMLTDRQDVTQTIVVKQEEKDELLRLRGGLLPVNN